MALSKTTGPLSFLALGRRFDILASKVSFYQYQKDAIERMHNGCILVGGVGSGKSRTSLGYFDKVRNGEKLFIITTAKKRDSKEWEDELKPFGLKATIDSWNNIKKYEGVKGAFFIFDEQRLVGSGVWAKAFLKIAKSNKWIVLSATPGDDWSDYVTIFVANGYFKNRSQFYNDHVVFSPFTDFPKIDRYLNVRRLTRLRERTLVDMDYKRETTVHHENIWVDYDRDIYKAARKNRWNVFKNEPMQNAAELCYVLRKIVNLDKSRLEKVEAIALVKKRVIIFYNFDDELEALRGLNYIYGTEVAEWNGHKHQPVPDCERWVYLVQYNAGAEGWNCIKTDTIIFFSQNYSYKTMVQAAGRIDRLTTPYKDLWYYHIKSKADIDLAISKALGQKKKFNERRFAQSSFKES